MSDSDRQFEDEVRKIARELWPSAQYGGAEIIDKRERDGIFEGEDFIHCIECTTSRQLAKAKEDAQKLDKLTKHLAAKEPGKFVKGWFITKDEPTPDQRSVFRKYPGRIITCSLDQFRSKLVDMKGYLSLRFKYPFGSVRDPKTNSEQFELQYIPLDLLSADGTVTSLDDLITNLEAGIKYVMTGDYGAGKSSTLRELFRKLTDRFNKKNSASFPLLLNLRDHHGETDPVEAIERHARKIGYTNPSQLVRAWRAGYCQVLLDGFDEIAAAGWTGSARKLRDLRYISMELIRGFVRGTPQGSGILIAGRANYFDSTSELQRAMALTSDYKLLQIGEFTTKQVISFLDNLGWRGHIPEWLPTRPLLLSYLYYRGFLSSDTRDVEATSPAVGWHDLMERISHREAELEPGIDPTAVRRLIEAIATAARSTPDGLGPISPDVLNECFREVCGYSPDDRATVLLQRLPGLGSPNVEDGSRVFIDNDFAEAGRSGGVFQFIADPFGLPIQSDTWQSTLCQLGSEMVAHRIQLFGFGQGKINAAAWAAYEKSHGHTLVADIMLALLTLGLCYEGQKLYIKGVLFDALRLEEEEFNLANVEFQDCVFSSIFIAADIPNEALPSFVRCLFANFEGRTGIQDIPTSHFMDCSFEGFDTTTKTTSGILLLPLPLPVKVLLTIIKKLFAQAGSGRKEAALYRGLDARAKEIVPSILDLLRREGFIVKSRQRDLIIWLPAKTPGVRKRAFSILASPQTSRDALIEEVGRE